MAQHHSLPSVAMELKGDLVNDEPGGWRTSLRFTLPRESLRRYDGWTAPAKLYLEESGEFVDIGGAVNDYRRRNRDFLAWFTGAVAEVHGADLVEQHFGHLDPPPDGGKLVAEFAQRLADLERSEDSEIRIDAVRDVVRPLLTILDERRLLLCRHQRGRWLNEAFIMARNRFVAVDLDQYADRLQALLRRA